MEGQGFNSYEEAEAHFMESITFRFIQDFRFAFKDNKRQMKEFDKLCSGLEEHEMEVTIGGRAAIFGVTECD